MSRAIFRSSPSHAAASAIAIFLLPLVGSGALVTLAPWMGAIACALMLVSQPKPDPGRMWSRTTPDRLSAAAIFASMIAVQLGAVVEYRFVGGWLLLPVALTTVAGVALVALGFGVRLWAIQTLGAWFTSTVEVRASQPVIASGPYAWARHPSYTGALMVGLGTLVMLHSAVGLALFVVTALPAYAHRIRVEERALVDELGAEYREYRERVPALLPRIPRNPETRATASA